ncbi:recombinase family protein [Halorhodospira neutriphila]|uniref:Resolvase n=1 Tax=Halorhodospira neutriphila TaxID=168379 RepID=A0ABS1E5I4_9GAMM|nr:recombinase family protein [Halorhodospira neutriphila]MBK1726367.1 resolvase [Halorhodospira neutriphila]
MTTEPTGPTGATIGYTRVSTTDQRTEGHRAQIERAYRIDHWYQDEATSGSTRALDRPGFAALYQYVREGDRVVVPAIDRLGRNTIDVLTTVEALREKGVAVVSVREGFDMSTNMGKMMLTMLAGVAELERENIRERQRAGLEKAKAEGRRLGRPVAADPAEVAAWRWRHGATIRQTAEHFGVGVSSVKRACKAHPAPPEGA